MMWNQTGILIVEDAPTDVFYFEQACAKAGVDMPIIHLTNGAQAIEYIENAASNQFGEDKLPRIVLTDLRMPLVSGFELLEFLKQHPEYGEIIPLVWSNSNEIADVRKAYELGARCYLPKPASEQGWRMLVERVSEFYEGSHSNQSQFSA